MRDRIELAPDAGLIFGQSRITVTLSGGRTKTAEALAAKGAPGNPAELDDLCAKFERCVAGRLSQSDASELRELLIHLEERDDLGRLFTLLGAAGERIH
jgi:2-methylcitrate dehydratase PrpD